MSVRVTKTSKLEYMGEFVQYLADGKTVKEVADIFKMNYRTAQDHVEEMRKLYSATTAAHLVAIFIRNNLIK